MMHPAVDSDLQAEWGVGGEGGVVGVLCEILFGEAPIRGPITY